MSLAFILSQDQTLHDTIMNVCIYVYVCKPLYAQFTLSNSLVNCKSAKTFIYLAHNLLYNKLVQQFENSTDFLKYASKSISLYPSFVNTNDAYISMRYTHNRHFHNRVAKSTKTLLRHTLRGCVGKYNPCRRRSTYIIRSCQKRKG